MSDARQFLNNSAEQVFLTEISDCFHRQAFLAESLAGEDPLAKWGLPNAFVSMFVADELFEKNGRQSLGLKGALRFAAETGASAQMPRALGEESVGRVESEVSIFVLVFGKDLDGEHAELNGQRFPLERGQPSSTGLDQCMKASFEIAKNSRASILAVDGVERVDPEKQRVICAALMAGGFSQIVCQVGRDFFCSQLSSELRDLSIVWEATPSGNEPSESDSTRPARGMGGRSRR